MDSFEMIIVAALILAGIAAIYLFSYFKEKKSLEKTPDKEADKNTLPLKLQAYERLVLLAERIAIPNLVGRVNQPGLSAREMQGLLTQTIRQEFEHNITQQIYVSAEAWEAIRNLKEQNILIINQVSTYLPESATGTDLNKSLMELLVENPKASLHNVVSEALSYEAKKLM
jgi:hypothetical protein